MKDYILCCDWGTSTFRLRLVHIAEQQIVAEVISQNGTANTYDAWKRKEEDLFISRENFFQQQLKYQIAAMCDQVNISLDNIPVIISGMASSSIGMKELPYANIPFAIDGSHASIDYTEPQPDFRHEVFLISGVKSEQDVMRGEETQLIGLIDLLHLLGHKITNAIFIFPGTHSKHIHVHNQQLANFQTYMTGEVFNLMAKQSILKDSTFSSGSTDLTEADLKGFKLGVEESGVSNILHGLFTVRTNHLFDILNKHQNFYYLSGLLIGTELRTLLPIANRQLILCSGSNLSEFYKIAIVELGLSSYTITIPPELVDKSTVFGQIKIFQNQKSPFIRIQS